MKKSDSVIILLQPQIDFRPQFSVSSCYCQFIEKLLFLRRINPNHWEVPGGKLEANESPLQAAIRELYEETSIISDPSKISFIQTLYIRYPGIDFTYHMFYQIFSKQPPITINRKEHTDFIWTTITGAKKILSTLGELEALEYYKNFMNKLTPIAT